MRLAALLLFLLQVSAAQRSGIQGVVLGAGS
jgi:hypothetical protein